MYKYKDIYTCILRNTCLYLIYYIMYVYIYIYISAKKIGLAMKDNISK